MQIFPLCIDEAAERAFGRLAAAEHRLRAEKGRFAEHVVKAGGSNGLNEAIAPVQDFVVIGNGNDGHGAVNMFTVFHRLDALGGMEPGLGDDDEGVAGGLADFVERGIGVMPGEFAANERVLCDAGDSLRFRIAEQDFMHEGVMGKEGGKRAAEGAETDETDSQTHEWFLNGKRGIGGANRN